MTDATLLHLMTELATRVRDMPSDELSDDVRQRLGAVIAHLADTGVLDLDARWNLGVRE